MIIVNANARLFSKKAKKVAMTVEALEHRWLLSAGDPDPAFGVGGAVSAHAFGGNGSFSGAVVQPNGKIIAYGVSYAADSFNEFELARFNSDGSADDTFGDHGQVSLSGENRSYLSTFSAVAVQKDGGILAVGYNSPDNGVTGNFSIERLLPGGVPDSAFATGGQAIIHLAGSYGSLANVVAVQNDGKILVGGVVTFQGQPTGGQFGAIVRLTTTGSLDSSFGQGGVVVLPQALSVDSIKLLKQGKILAQNVLLDADGTVDPAFTPISLTQGPFALQSDGKFVAASGNQVFRYNADGTADTSFGADGVVQTTIPGNFIASNVVITANGAIIVAGTEQNFTSDDNVPNAALALERFTASGAVDTRYGFNGVSATPVFYGAANASGAVIQPDGRVIVPGFDQFDVTQSPGSFGVSIPILARFTTNGRLDDTFGYHGTVESPNGITGTINAMVVENNGKIIVAGSEESPLPGVEPTDAALACYNLDGTLDTTFGVNGMSFLQIGNNANFTSLQITSDGNLIAGGYGQSAGVTVFALVRYKPNGRIDSTFGHNGRVLTTFGDRHGQVSNAMALQANGDIVAVGETLDATGNPLQIAAARYLPSGAIDPTFGKRGQVLLSPGGMPALATSVAIDANGRLILGGAVGYHYSIVCLNTLGGLDAAFGTNGVATNGLSSVGRILAVAVDAFGNIVADGEGPDLFDLTRFHPDGTLDATFGTGGTIALSYYQGIYSLALQPDGQILTGGTTGEATIARFNSMGLDPTLGIDQLTHVTTGMRGSPLAPPVTALAIQPDGKILAATGTDIYRVLGG